MCALGLNVVPMLAQGAYDYQNMQLEKLGRGVVAVRENPDEVILSWRYLVSDPENQSFDIYRDGKKINKTPLEGATYYKDKLKAGKAAKYEVRPVKGGASGSASVAADAPMGYINIPLDVPERGVEPFGKEYTYNANDASVGDVDGDGEYEIILKWDPTDSHDNAHDGFTGPTYFDCYMIRVDDKQEQGIGTAVVANADFILCSGPGVYAHKEHGSQPGIVTPGNTVLLYGAPHALRLLGLGRDGFFNGQLLLNLFQTQRLGRRLEPFHLLNAGGIGSTAGEQLGRQQGCQRSRNLVFFHKD